MHHSTLRLLTPVLALVVATAAAASTSSAAVVTFSDLASFQADTGATAEAPLPNLGATSGSFTAGNLTYSLGAGGTALFVGTNGLTGIVNNDWSLRLAGNDIAISAFENLNVVEAATPIYSLGFEFHEPENDPNVNATFVDSTFTVTLMNGLLPVGLFTFNAPNDVAAFVGVQSTLAFNRVEIRETIGGSENEFYGQFYTGATPLIPLPAAVWPGLVLLTALAAPRLRRSLHARATR